MNASDRLRRRFLSWPNLIGFLVGLVLLGFLLSQLDLEATVRLLAQTDGTWFLVGCLLYLANNLARSYRFVRLTRAPLHRIPTMLGVVLAMSLANQVLPARLGELSYVYLAHKSQSLPVGQGLVSLLIARLFDLVAIGLLFVLGAGPLLGQLPTPALTYFWIALVSMALVVGVIGALVVWRRALCRLALRLLAARPLSRVPGQARIARLVGDVEVGLDALGGPRQVVDLLSSSLAVWLSNFGML
ncbi:MAG: flippase-like domain-containing protein, partial [Chloroflexi bacterium]|nr:flippase-like domain-containing protein [Chloroflexota bacterium]